jgi:hypothetical protein
MAYTNKVTNVASPLSHSPNKTYVQAAVGITWKTPPVEGDAYYDNHTGQSMVYTKTGWMQMGTIPNHKPTQDVKIPMSNGEWLSIDEVGDFMAIMKRRMLILTPDFQKHEKYPVLKEIYEQYCVIDKLINEQHGDQTDE